jgi:tripartite-type tricarboxylate transporter receptor subunit TctC
MCRFSGECDEIFRDRKRCLYRHCSPVALNTPAVAQQWPARQVRLIVPYPAGGNVDSAARVIADRLQPSSGQPFIVENKAGAGGLIAGEAFAKSQPDGYALFVGANGPVLFAPEIAKRDAYNWKRDFVPISSITMTPLVLEVHPSVPAKDLKEFIELARRDPGKLTMASPGQGTTNHLLSELMQSTLGLEWLTVHYRGNAPALNDLIGGQVQFALDQISVGLPSIKSGMLRPLAVTGTHRASWLPDVPTFTELGYTEFDGQTFTGLFAPSAHAARDRDQAARYACGDPERSRHRREVQRARRRGRIDDAGGVHELPRARGRQVDSRGPQGQHQG